MPVVTILIVAYLIGTSGCGNENKLGRRAVSGKITFAGKPLDYGSIEFHPEQTQGVSAGGVVSEDGSYSISEAKGLPPGMYVVSVYSSYAKSETGGPVHMGPGHEDDIIQEERIPPEFNIDSKQIVEITPEGPNKFDFNIPVK